MSGPVVAMSASGGTKLPNADVRSTVANGGRPDMMRVAQLCATPPGAVEVYGGGAHAHGARTEARIILSIAIDKKNHEIRNH
jgi:hypothetical protein